MAYGHFKDLDRRTTADEVLSEKAFNIAKSLKYNEYQRGFASMVYKYFDKKTTGETIKNEAITNIELAVELHRPILKRFKKRKVHSPFRDNI